MENYTITMRIYTELGKEHIYNIDYYHIEDKNLTVHSTKQDDDIFSTIKCGGPCYISLSSCGNKYEFYKECCLNNCLIKNNSITFKSLDNSPCRR